VPAGQILRDAIKAVPAMRYALAVVGLAAATALVVAFTGGQLTVAIIGIPLILVAMIVLVVFANLAQAGAVLYWPVRVMVWTGTLAFATLIALLFSAAMFRWPPALHKLLFPKDDDKPLAVLKRDALKLLTAMYASDYETAYNAFSPTIRRNLTFVEAKDTQQKMMRQFPMPPEHRDYERIDAVNQFKVLHFKAQFDEATTFREVVTFAPSDAGLELWHIDIFDIEFPFANQDRWFNTPADKMDHLQESEGRWLVAPWRVSVLSIGTRKGRQTCDVFSEEPKLKKPINLIGTLGGCGLKPGESLSVAGKFSAANANAWELSRVRFMVMPAETPNATTSQLLLKR